MYKLLRSIQLGDVFCDEKHHITVSYPANRLNGTPAVALDACDCDDAVQAPTPKAAPVANASVEGATSSVRSGTKL